MTRILNTQATIEAHSMKVTGAAEEISANVTRPLSLIGRQHLLVSGCGSDRKY